MSGQARHTQATDWLDRCRHVGVPAAGEFMTRRILAMAGVRPRAGDPNAPDQQPRGGDELPCPARRGQPAHQRGGRLPARRGARRRGRRRSRGRDRRTAGTAARRAGDDQDQCRLRGARHHQRRGGVQGSHRASRQSAGGELAQGRRDHHRPHQRAAVQRAVLHRQCALRTHAQSLGCRPHAGRIKRRRRRRGGDRHRRPRPRQRPRGLDPLSGLCVRRRRAATDARPRPDVRAERARRTFDHHAIDSRARPAGALGPRSPARPRHDGGARSA